MAEIINLRRVRKGKAREEKAKLAEANRAIHGRTAGERARDEDAKARLVRALDQAKRE